MDDFQDLLHVTQTLNDVIEKSHTYPSRERLIADINQLVEKRGRIMKSIQPPFSKSEQQIGEQIIQMNQTIQTEMNQIFSDLKIEMKQIQQRKRSNQSYANPYSHLGSIDGMFMDRKN